MRVGGAQSLSCSQVGLGPRGTWIQQAWAWESGEMMSSLTGLTQFEWVLSGQSLGTGLVMCGSSCWKVRVGEAPASPKR